MKANDPTTGKERGFMTLGTQIRPSSVLFSLNTNSRYTRIFRFLLKYKHALEEIVLGADSNLCENHFKARICNNLHKYMRNLGIGCESWMPFEVLYSLELWLFWRCKIFITDTVPRNAIIWVRPEILLLPTAYSIFLQVCRWSVPSFGNHNSSHSHRKYGGQSNCNC